MEQQSTKRLLNNARANPKLQQLRERINAIIHLDPENPAITVDQQWANRNELEQDARHVVELMFEAFYFDPGDLPLLIGTLFKLVFSP